MDGFKKFLTADHLQLCYQDLLFLRLEWVAELFLFYFLGDLIKCPCGKMNLIKCPHLFRKLFNAHELNFSVPFFLAFFEKTAHSR